MKQYGERSDYMDCNDYNRMPTNVDLTKYTSPKKYGIYLQEKKHKRKRKW